MKLDFNETNILIHAINDMEKYKKPINKTNIIGFLHELARNTNPNYTLLHKAVNLLVAKLEPLSDENILQIYSDIKSNKMVATLCYSLPER